MPSNLLPSSANPAIGSAAAALGQPRFGSATDWLGCLDGGLGIPEMTVITCGQDEFDFRIGSIASVLTVGQPLPVYPRQRTSPRPVGMSQMCPQADMAQPRWV